MKSKVFVFVHVLSQSLGLASIVMQADSLFLFDFISAIEHPWVYMCGCVTELILDFSATYILISWVNRWALNLILLALSFCSYVFGFAQILLLIDQTFILLVILIESWFLKVIYILNFFVNTFIWSA